MKEELVLTAQTLLNMSIRDFQHYAQYVGEEKLWELYFNAQKDFGHFYNVSYLISPNPKKEGFSEDGN